MPQWFRLKPIEAMQYTAETCRALHRWIGVEHNDEGVCGVDIVVVFEANGEESWAEPGDWVTKSDRGRAACSRVFFEKYYEPV
jgi:hypothetical protein